LGSSAGLSGASQFRDVRLHGTDGIHRRAGQESDTGQGVLLDVRVMRAALLSAAAAPPNDFLKKVSVGFGD